jgi:hypothetical protein
MADGTVSTQASAMLRTVASCSPDPLADIVPAMPDESTCVVDTGRPKPSAAAMVAAAVISAQAPRYLGSEGWLLVAVADHRHIRMTTKGLPFVDRENEFFGATALTVGDSALAAHLAGGSVRL